MRETTSLEEVIRLEQHFIESIKPNLNVDTEATGSGYHEPMTLAMREKLHKQRATPVYLYNCNDFALLYLFDSKQQIYDSLGVHHVTLNKCLDNGELYLGAFFLSLDPIQESSVENLITLEQLKSLVQDKRSKYEPTHPAARIIIAEHKGDSRKNLEFCSLNSLAKHMKGDRQVIRKYVKGETSGYYRGI